jgi:hypothetical protein
MELVSIMRLLWTRRLWACVGLALAIVVGVAVTHKIGLGFPPKLESRQYHQGVASINVLIDTPSSQVADLRPPIGADVLGTRASLFASLISTPPLKVLIARRVGIPVSQLTTSPSAAAPAVPSPVANVAPRTAQRANTYRLEAVAQELLPIIGITAEAPDAKRAALLANGTFEALKEYLAGVADRQRVPARRRPAVTAFGSATSADVVRGPGRMLGLIAGMLVFGLVCAGIVVGTGLARSWRQAAASEGAGADAPREPVPDAGRRAGADLAQPSAGKSRTSLRPTRRKPAGPKAPDGEADDPDPQDEPERVTSIGRHG